MAQQKYASTDPNFGLEQKYASTDPNFGAPAPKEESGILDFINRQLGPLRKGMEAVAQELRGPGLPTIFSNGPLGYIEREGRSQAAGMLQTLAHPVDNASSFGALAAQAVPPLRAASTVVKYAPTVLSKVPRLQKGAQALRDVLFGARRSAAGGAVGGAATAADRGEDMGMGAVEGAAFEGGLDLLTGGGLLAGGQTLRGTGRQLGYRALSPTDMDLAAIHKATHGTPEGYRTLPRPFIPSSTRHLLKDELEREATSGNMVGSFGGTSNAMDAIIAADTSDALQERIVRQTLQKTNASELTRQAAEAAAASYGTKSTGEAFKKMDELFPASTQFEQMMPKAEFGIDLNVATTNARALADQLGQMGESARPLKDSKKASTAITDLLSGKPDMRPRAISTPLLGEPRVDVPLARPSGQTDNLGSWVSVDRAVNRQNSLKPTFANTQRVDKYGPMPTRPAQYTAEAQGGGVPRPAPETLGATISVAADEARRLGVIPPTPEGSVSVGFDRAVKLIHAIDKQLNSKMQSKLRATSRSENYIPGPDEQALMKIRGDLRTLINSKAPTTTDLRGNTRDLASVLDDQQRDIIMRDLKVRATGEDVGNIKARVGYNPQSGRPAASLYENIQRFGGAASAPLIRGGNTALNNAPVTPQVARLLWLLMNRPDASVSAPMDAPGVGR